MLGVRRSSTRSTRRKPGWRRARRSGPGFVGTRDLGFRVEGLGRRHPLRFKGLCKRVKQLTIQQHTVTATLDRLHRDLRRRMDPTTDPDKATPEMCEICLPCRRGFTSRVSWAGHAARKHSYRTWAFLLPDDNVCRACGKVFASIGRLRRHLIAAPPCLAGWGSFVPGADAAANKPHPLAPPIVASGYQAPPPAIDFSGRINESLLAELSRLDGVEEADVWALIEACIEPLATLRSTVEAWQAAAPSSAWKSEVAENMLLLLDPSITADTQQPSAGKHRAALASCPEWTSLASLPMSQTGSRYAVDLPAPPPKSIDPSKPTSVTVRDGAAYVIWLKAACELIAKCVDRVAQQPVRLRCPGFSSSLGPAKGWLEDCGFLIDEQGLASPS